MKHTFENIPSVSGGGGTGEELIEYTVEDILFFGDNTTAYVTHKADLPKLTTLELNALMSTEDIPGQLDLDFDRLSLYAGISVKLKQSSTPQINFRLFFTDILLNNPNQIYSRVVVDRTLSSSRWAYYISKSITNTSEIITGGVLQESKFQQVKDVEDSVSFINQIPVVASIPLGYKITGFVQNQAVWAGNNYQVGNVLTTSIDGFGPISLNVDEVDDRGKFTKLSILTSELSDFIFEDIPTFTPPENPPYGAPVSGGSGFGGRVSPILEIIPSDEAEDTTISEVTSSGNKLITSSLVDGKISKAMGTPSRIENTGNTQFVDTNSDNISIDLMPSLSQGGGSETGRLKLARNMFELSAEMIYANPNLKYKYSFKSKDDGSIEIKVEDTDELSGKGTETYSFDFTSQDNPNQVTRKFEVDLAIQQAIEDVLLGEV